MAWVGGWLGVCVGGRLCLTPTHPCAGRHVAPAYVELSFASVLAAPAHTWAATQELYEPMLNTTLAAGTDAEVRTSAVFAPETNVMTVRLHSAKATTLSLRLSTQLPSACQGRTSCMADLPMTFATTKEADGGAALTMTRLANHWVNNEAVLVECDPQLHPTMGQREFAIDSSGAISLQNVSYSESAPPRDMRSSDSDRRVVANRRRVPGGRGVPGAAAG